MAGRNNAHGILVTSQDEDFADNLSRRHRTAKVWQIVLQASTVIGIVVLMALLLNIMDGAFGYAAVQNKVDPETPAVDGIALKDLPKEQLIEILQANISAGLFRRFESEKPFAERSREEIYDLVVERVVEPEVVGTWPLFESLLHRADVLAEAAEAFPSAEVRFTSWINPQFVVSPQSANPEQAGVRTAILGSLWTIAITIGFAFPLGVGAAIYLEEYATDNRLNRIIQTNINNLAGVPSIIYGMLGLAVFVRLLGSLTSGQVFGLVDPTTANGRTILSAGLTLGLLILPLLIINAQEAIKA
ncbi:MAG: phosphate ABC transporter permease, partial [Anaerolineae bacterium]